MEQCISCSNPRCPNCDPESLRNLEMQEINAYLYCEREEKSTHMFSDKWQGIEIDAKERKIIEVGGVLRSAGNMLVSVMGRIAGGEGKVEKVEEVMSLGNFLLSS